MNRAVNFLTTRFVDDPASLAVDNKPDIATCTVTHGKKSSISIYLHFVQCDFFHFTDETITSHVICFARPMRFLSILNSIDNNQNIA